MESGKLRKLLAPAALILCGLLLCAGGPSDSIDADAAAAPIRQLIALQSAKSVNPVCVGQVVGNEVLDFPSAALGDELAAHKWVRQWSACPRPDPWLHPHSPMPARLDCGVTGRERVSGDPVKVTCDLESHGDFEVEYTVAESPSGHFVVRSSKMIHMSVSWGPRRRTVAWGVA
jgi:hypothetical protein